MDESEIIKAIFTQAGAVGAILLIGVMAMFKLYLMERNDRREAWREFNKLAKETNLTLQQLTLVLNSIKEHQK